MTTSLPQPFINSAHDHATSSQASSFVRSEGGKGGKHATTLQTPAKDHPESARMQQLQLQGQSLSEIAQTMGVPETEVLAELGLSIAGASSSSDGLGFPATGLPSGALAGLSIRA